MKKMFLFLLVWVLLSVQGVLAIYRETLTSTHNVFSIAFTSLTPSVTPVTNHIVINEIQTKGITANQDFIELYNPTAASIDMSGWKIRKRISTGTESSLVVIPASISISSHRYLLWANTLNGYSATLGADLANTSSLADNNSIALLNASDVVIDQVSWGTGINQFKEGTGYPDNPGASQSIERKTGLDTDHNETDFLLRLLPSPKNKLSPPE